MKPSVPAVKLTYDDFLLFPDDGKRHELIDGEHFVTASPNLKHQLIVGQLYRIIGNWLELHPVGRVILAPFDVIFSHFDVVEPDLLFISDERAGDVLTEQGVRGAPDLVIEVTSKSTRRRDETLKLRLYERSGVSEYWVVDPAADAVRVYRRRGERFARAQAVSADAGDTLHTPLMPGLVIPLARVFTDRRSQ